MWEARTGFGEWVKSSPQPRKGHSLTYSPFDNKIYLFGGWNPLEWNCAETYFDEVWTLDASMTPFYISEWNWDKDELFGKLPSARRGHSCVYSPHPTPSLVVFGGICGYNKFTDDLYVLKLNKKKWKLIEPSEAAVKSPPLAWHSATLIGDVMYFIGGLLEGEDYNTDVFALNLSSLVWKKIQLANGTT